MKKNTFTLTLLFFLLIFFSSVKIYSQTINVSDNVFFNVKENTSLVIPGNLNIGDGTSGVVKMDGDLLKVLGSLFVNAGAELEYTQGDLNIATYTYDDNSIVTFDGNNQTVMNHDYGNLVFEGTGTMLISGDFETPTTCNNFTVNNTGNSVLISENKAITVNGTFTNNAGNSGVKVVSSGSGDGSLIFSTSDVSGTVQRYCSNTQWHYISAPINDAPTSMFSSGYFLAWDATMQWNGLGDYEPWYTYSGSEMAVSKGYGYFSSDDVVSFEGTMNVADYTQTLYKNSGGLADNQGWNLVGNPYTSAIDWDLAVDDGAVPAGAENAIYLFDDDNGNAQQSNYRYYVPSSGGTYGVGTADATNNIPVGQGFFVKTNTNNVTLNIKSSYRIHNTQDFYKSVQTGICRINFSGNDLTDQTVLRLVDGANLGFDAKFDARKLYATNENFPQVYSLNTDFNSVMAINSIPNDFEQMKIPIGIKASAGYYSISIAELSIYADNMYFLDSKRDVKISLNNDFNYQFYFSGGIENDRFFIVFYDDDKTIQDDFTDQTSIVIFPNPTSDICTISNLNTNSEIIISDVSGKTLSRFYSSNSNEQINLSNYSSGIYYVNIISDNQNITKKIIKK
ncbi:MAG: T9SS type A sorting domain-containing protein [Bacteroidales bacterium]|nr:T9SS type A sorting domain-containing protein [Bacteroidales bacterium]